MMELKRYLLLDDREIKDTTKMDFVRYGLEDYDVIESNIWTHHYYDGGNHAYNGWYNYQRNIIKQSDNILDLVEVGDLIETYNDYDRETYYTVKTVKNVSNEILFVTPNGHYDLKTIKAIWKRQGDKFQRYEIERAK